MVDGLPRSKPKGPRGHWLESEEMDAKIVQWASYKLRGGGEAVPTEETKGRNYVERRVREVEKFLGGLGPATFLTQLEILVEQRRNRPAAYHAFLAVFTSEAWREDFRSRERAKDQAWKCVANVFLGAALQQDLCDTATAEANAAAARRELETWRGPDRSDAEREDVMVESSSEDDESEDDESEDDESEDVEGGVESGFGAAAYDSGGEDDGADEALPDFVDLGQSSLPGYAEAEDDAASFFEAAPEDDASSFFEASPEDDAASFFEAAPEDDAAPSRRPASASAQRPTLASVTVRSAQVAKLVPSGVYLLKGDKEVVLVDRLDLAGARRQRSCAQRLEPVDEDHDEEEEDGDYGASPSRSGRRPKLPPSPFLPKGAAFVNFHEHSAIASDRERLLILRGVAMPRPLATRVLPRAALKAAGVTHATFKDGTIRPVMRAPASAAATTPARPSQIWGLSGQHSDSGFRDLDKPAYTMCRRGIHVVAADRRSRAPLSHVGWHDAFHGDAFTKAIKGAARKAKHGRNNEQFSKYKPPMAERIIAELVKELDDNVTTLVLFDYYATSGVVFARPRAPRPRDSQAGCHGFALGAIKAWGERGKVYVFSYETFEPLELLHHALPKAGGEFQAWALGPAAVTYEVDHGDGTGWVDEKGVGEAKLFADKEAKLKRVLEELGVDRADVHVCGAASATEVERRGANLDVAGTGTPARRATARTR
ncbi:hypothetical protein JL722_7691 [Aureococcus anophagefferens]|nr:hypothetical protein JL722_7691 [Aureococcus anophagefferens]